jgi:hypothetical protein
VTGPAGKARTASLPRGAQATLVTHLTNFGTIRKVGDAWLFSQMHFCSASPISVDTIYHT